MANLFFLVQTFQWLQLGIVDFSTVFTLEGPRSLAKEAFVLSASKEGGGGAGRGGGA